MIIPFKEIPIDTLNNLIESFILREGTDYGEAELSLNDKISHIKNQLEQGDAVITYSELHETINIMPKTTFQQNKNEFE
ncbi:hypothetical protein CJF42_17950 [Pseudoalteromonas sp. NBT06-2]|uniref:YheU family protein n=1 Tax=Pseudoalteromonas sp. NBT06-2 TaxID=2025950 RepID=UPI000BA77F1D|nr:YheU family protein [Pseudoalteromonas sp. NBT06-2]PAJ73048.1 hypothetical protein CJF42_17950 [Pseudoalteromonas sp. NBT06-2]